jgi:hypothetical protein
MFRASAVSSRARTRVFPATSSPVAAWLAADADGFRLRLRDEQGGQYLVGAGDFDLMARRGRLLFRRSDSAGSPGERGREVIVQTFAERYHLAEGMRSSVHREGPRGFIGVYD